MLYKHPEIYSKMKCTQCEFVSVNPDRLKQHLLNHEKGLLNKEEETQKVEHISKTLNTSIEVSQIEINLNFKMKNTQSTWVSFT